LLCFALLCFALLCFALLCFALICFALLCFALLCCGEGEERGERIANRECWRRKRNKTKAKETKRTEREQYAV
jgi:hypothetical protein